MPLENGEKGDEGKAVERRPPNRWLATGLPTATGTRSPERSGHFPKEFNSCYAPPDPADLPVALPTHSTKPAAIEITWQNRIDAVDRIL